MNQTKLKKDDRGRPRRRRSRTRSGGTKDEASVLKEPKSVVHVPKTYAVLFFDSHAAAKRDVEVLAAKAATVGQLNIVIRAEGDMEDPELTQYGKVFAGAAWTLIHERRVAEGWYNEPR